MIIGVTGFFCAGKDTLAAILEERSFGHISLSDMIRDEIRRRGQRVTLARTVEVGNELRRASGPRVLARMALERVDPTKNYVITSIRGPGEIEALRQRRDFVLLFVESSARKRYERSRRRKRADEAGSLAQFQAAERAQMRSDDPAAQQLLACRDAADLKIRNDSTVEALERRVVKALHRIVREFLPPRPTWDEYFMAIAEVAAARSNCVKRRIGAIIAQNKQIVSAGYNGTPKGIDNCDEGGCPRCWGFGAPGKGLDECLCVHAEENAIVQAACNGISIQGSTLYSTLCPCLYCAKSIINAGISRVVYRDAYAMDRTTAKLFAQAGVEMIVFEKDAEEGA
jgi:dCMP deaminase